MEHRKRKLIEDCLGLSFEVLEESWNDLDGPSNEDYRVMQRGLILLGYATGEKGRSWIDGILGPNTRRALTQFQTETGLEVSGRFDEATRPRLYNAAVDFLAALDEKVIVGCQGQLQRLANQSDFTGKNAVYYYVNEAKSRVEEGLVSCFLTLAAAPNGGQTTVSLDLVEYQQRLAQGIAPREVRLAASRFGFLQLHARIYEENALDVKRARVCGDIDFHLDTIAHLLHKDERLREAGLRHDAAAVAGRFPRTRISGVGGTEMLAAVWTEIDACLPK